MVGVQARNHRGSWVWCGRFAPRTWKRFRSSGLDLTAAIGGGQTQVGQVLDLMVGITPV